MMNLNSKLFVSMLSILPAVVQADIQPLDDGLLGDVTGQAGISIDLSAKIKMGEFRYTDGGSVAIENIVIGGANKQKYFNIDWGPGSHSGDMLDGIKLDIDVANDGDLWIVAKPLPAYGNLVDFGVSTGAWRLMQSSGVSHTALLSSLNFTGVASELKIRIDESTSVINLQAGLGIDDLDMEIDFLGIGIEDAVIAGTGYIANMEVSSYGLSDLMMPVNLNIYKGNKGLKFDVVQFEADIVMPTINIGGASIGGVYVHDLQLNGSTFEVYGH